MSSVVSRQIGEGNPDRVRRIVTHGLIIAILTALFLAIIGILTLNPVFRAMGAQPDMMPLIRDYMLIWFAGSVFVTLPMVGNAAIRATGDSFLPAIIMTVAALMNVVLDPLLIFGLAGFPRMELQGAALATVIANGAAMIAGLYILHSKKRLICRDGLHLRHFKDSFKRLAYIALPAGLTGILQPLTNAVIISLLASHGAAAVAAFGVVTRMEAFAFSIIMGLATGMAPIVGQNWGALKFARVNETLRKTFGFAALWSLFVAVTFVVFAEPLTSLFAKDDESGLVEIAALYFWIVALTYIPGNLVQGWGSAFNAMGKPQRSFMMIVIKLLILQIPLAFIGSHYFGIIGIFGAMAVTNIVTGIIFHLLNRRICLAKEEAVKNPS
jgi:putative MATE family efflux protein